MFLGYYYKDEDHHDQTVSVRAMLDMFEQLGTPAELKRSVAFPEANQHVIANQYLSQDWQNVRDQTFHFAEEVLGLKPLP